jgi:two-component system response regulator NreC
MTRYMPIDVLLVDDMAPFRDAVRSMLGHYEMIRIVGEASDGIQALEKVAELRPTLVLLDISLPGMNGINVASRVLALYPETIILFLSMHRSSHFVREAMQTGARGYLLKGSAARDLWPAIQAVVRNDRFVSEQIGFEVQAPA